LASRQAFHCQEAEIVSIDLDPEALHLSQQQVVGMNANVKTTFISEHVLTALRRFSKDTNEIGTYDAILFGGLFDYLPDRMIAFLLKVAMRLLRPGGEICFSRVSIDSPDRTFMKWFGDWELLERDEQSLLRICNEAGIDAHAVSLRRKRCNIAILGRVMKCEATPMDLRGRESGLSARLDQ
jgi:extracellular factor (EF) 3-hydroxypalmitic acid methyl ester biosynthesis protein